MADPLTVAELRAWREKYAGTPWTMLALATAAANDPSPIKVMQRLFDLMEMNAPASPLAAVLGVVALPSEEQA